MSIGADGALFFSAKISHKTMSEKDDKCLERSNLV